MRSTDDDADGVATKLTFDEDDHTTHDGAGSSGLLAARALAATLSTAHSEVAWLPMENQRVAHQAIDQALRIASMQGPGQGYSVIQCNRLPVNETGYSRGRGVSI